MRPRLPARGRAGRSLVPALLLAWLCLPGGVCSWARAADPIVILLSWDGTRHDYPDRAALPALGRMQREGARGQLIPVFPANTFPSHVSLATGARPARHGIVGNTFRDRERGLFRYSSDASWIDAEPLWIAAERQGVRAAVYFWVGSETNWRGRRATYRVAPFDTSVDEPVKVDRILAWLDLPGGRRPRLILSWWHGADAVGHHRGPDHPDVMRQLRRQDRALARLLAGLDQRRLWSSTTLIVTSDHGMARVDRAIDLAAVLEGEGVKAQVLGSGGTSLLWIGDPARRAEALSILRGVEGVQAWPSHALPAALGGCPPDRCGDIVAMTEPPLWFHRSSLLDRLAGLRGAHGFQPDRPEMAGILFALGRGVPRSLRLGPVRAIDVAPTVARLLGIDPPLQSEGRPIPVLGGDP